MRSLYKLCEDIFNSWLVIVSGMNLAVKMFKRDVYFVFDVLCI